MWKKLGCMKKRGSPRRKSGLFILRAPNAEQVPSGKEGVRCLRVPTRSGREEAGWQSEGSSFRSSLPPRATENFPGPLAMARDDVEGSSCRGLDVFGRRLSCGVESRLDRGKRRSVAFGRDEDDQDRNRNRDGNKYNNDQRRQREETGNRRQQETRPNITT